MEYHTVAREDEVREGEALRCEIDGYPIALFRCEGAIYAVDDTCSHAFASLSEGEVDGCTVTCPRHGGQFDVRTGRAVRLPAIAKVRSYPVRVEAGRVAVGFEAEDDDDYDD